MHHTGICTADPPRTSFDGVIAMRRVTQRSSTLPVSVTHPTTTCNHHLVHSVYTR